MARKSKTELAGAHPQHSSSTGDNFNVNVAKGLWHCWRHCTGGDALSLIAVCEGLVPCEAMRAGALRGKDFTRVVAIANETFQAGIVLDAEKRRNGETSEAAPRRPPTDYSDTNMTEVIDAAEAALLHLPGAPVLFQRARRLCAIA